MPTDNIPLSIPDDSNDNLFFTYISSLAFGGTAGGSYKYAGNGNFIFGI